MNLCIYNPCMIQKYEAINRKRLGKCKGNVFNQHKNVTKYKPLIYVGLKMVIYDLLKIAVNFSRQMDGNI